MNKEIIITCREIGEDSLFMIGEVKFSSKEALFQYLDQKLEDEIRGSK